MSNNYLQDIFYLSWSLGMLSVVSVVSTIHGQKNAEFHDGMGPLRLPTVHLFPNLIYR